MRGVKGVKKADVPDSSCHSVALGKESLSKSYLL